MTKEALRLELAQTLTKVERGEISSMEAAQKICVEASEAMGYNSEQVIKMVHRFRDLDEAIRPRVATAIRKMMADL